MPGQNPFDINARAVVGFGGIWKVHSGIQTFTFMKFVRVMGKDISKSYSKIATRSMLEAANELHAGDDNLLCNIGV